MRNAGRESSSLLRAASVLLALAVAGCGGGAPPAAAPAAAPPAAAAPVTAAPVAVAAAAPATTRSTATKWIGGIPYDVYYDRPLEVAADQTLLAANSAAPAPAALPSAAPTPAPTPAAAAMPAAAPAASPAPAASAAGGIDWATIAPIEILQEEVTRLRNDLQAKLNTVGDYNKSWESIGVDAVAIAAIAGVVEQHPGEISWKPNAPLVRHLASEINANASKTGVTAFKATKAPFDSLVDLLSGNVPSGVTAEPNLPFGDYADRSVLMATIESSLNYAKSNVNTDERLKSDAVEAKRKMTVLATLMSIVTAPSYGSTDEPDYQNYAQTFIQAAQAGRDAVDAKDITSFTNAVNVMQKTCAECHAKYAL